MNQQWIRVTSRLVVLLVLAIGLSGLSACGDDIQLADPPEGRDATAGRARPSSQPSKAAHGTPSKIESHGSVGGQEAGSKANDPFASADVGSRPSSRPSASSAKAEVVFTGTVTLDPSIKLPSTYTVYVNAGVPPKGSPPVLSVRIPSAPKFPLQFKITNKDLAFGDTNVDRPLSLYVILSESGFVMAETGVYIKTKPTAATALGTKDIQLVLAKP